MGEDIDRLVKMWDGFDRKALDDVYSAKEPLVSFVMLSWLRFNKLIKTLYHFLDTVKIPMNIALRVQGAEHIDKKLRARILEAVSGFRNIHVSFREKNYGSGVPRWEMLQEAKKFETPYIAFTDDDMLVKKGETEAKISLLKSRPNLGAVASWCSPGYAAWNIVGKNLLPRPPRPPFDYVDACGSATTIMRSKVFEKCDLDKDFYVGWGDFDLCMQLRMYNWKCGILALPQLKAVNDVAGDPVEYRQTRYNSNHAANSAKLFYKKWRIKIGR